MSASSSTSYRPGCYGAIDIGTVTCRLLVANVAADGALFEVLRAMRICNLGVGVDRTHRLDSEAIARVASAVREFMDEVHGVEASEGVPVTMRAMATSASRDAQNAEEFRCALEAAGIVPEIIPGEQEAALSFMGATSAFPGEKVVVVDVGGGSTEIIAGVSGKAPSFAHSFDVGCRRMTERFLPSDPPTPEEIVRAAQWVRDEMGIYIAELREAQCFDGLLLAVAGTATSAVTMRDGITEYDPALVHGVAVKRTEIDALLEHLASCTLEERRTVPGLEPDRAPVIVAGMIILQQIMDLAGVGSFTVSESDILHGILLATAASR